jgi:AmmeMemoRadiSam system protein B
VAGLFYPAQPDILAALVDRLVAAGRPEGPPPDALIVPHAAYEYSGPVAGVAYARVAARRGVVTRVVALGPAHRVWLRGSAASGADGFETPLGTVEIDDELRRRALACLGMAVNDAAHAREHAIEVQLPFLQRVLGAVRVLPVVVGAAATAEVAAILDAVWGGPETLVVVSSDLSHYLDHTTATTRDRRTAAAIVARMAERVGDDDACGACPIRGLLAVARRRALDVRLLDLRTSADTAGDSERVVGYGAFAVG